MTEQTNDRTPGKARMVAWTLAALMLLVPLIAMQFSGEVKWTASDFLVAGAIIGGIGLMGEFLVRVSRDGFYRAGAGAALAAVFLTVWSNLAVGIAGDGANGFNLTYMGLIALAVFGAILVRFRPGGMAVIAILAVASMLVFGVAAQQQEPHIWAITAFLSAPWVMSAALFWQAERNRTAG